MKAAFAVWDTNISPVFDVTRQIFLVDAEAGKIIGEKKETLRDEMPGQKALHLSELGVRTLVCGAISRNAQAMVEGLGIRVIPFVTGELHDVIHAWLSDSLESDQFAMPGCCRQRHRRGCAGLHRGNQEEIMRGRNRNGSGPRGRSGGGPGGGGRRRAGPGMARASGSSASAGPGTCVCPKCGQREPHQRGEPCAQKQCPQCGAAMSRG